MNFKALKGSVLAVALLASSLGAQAQYKCDQVIHKSSYDICYNYSLKEPLWVKYGLKKANLNGEHYSRKGIRFFEEMAVPLRYRARLSDYKGSGFDRGHLLANGARNYNRALQKSTFTLANMHPQFPNNNRGIFKNTERLERRLAKINGEAITYTGGVFERINPKRIGAGRIAVPTHSYKVIYFPKTRKTVSFLIPNIKQKQGKKASYFRVDKSVIEKMIGFKFQF